MPLRNHRNCIDLLLIAVIIGLSVLSYSYYKTNKELRIATPVLKMLKRDAKCTPLLEYVILPDFDTGFEDRIGIAKALEKKGYTDRFLMLFLSQAALHEHNFAEAIHYTEKALDAEYYCQAMKPSNDESLLIEKGYMHATLSRLYEIQGNGTLHDKHLQSAYAYFQQAANSTLDQKSLDRLITFHLKMFNKHVNATTSN